MDTATISAVAALGGTAIGGLTSGLTTLLNQYAQARTEQISHGLIRRQDLVRDFIVSASKTYGEAMVSNEPNVQELVGLYSMLSRMRVLAMPRTVDCGEKLMKAIIETYFAPNRTLRELHELVKNGGNVDPLRDFSEAARVELDSIGSRF
ncbi:MAG: hypothetical protein JO288_22785 [Hyphomicrobiales bacterium]|nr:hypothetical protein [Hyphomicrobiales bacterium]